VTADDSKPNFTALADAFAAMPTKPIPHELTPEGQRMTAFRKVWPARFQEKLDRKRLKNPKAFDAVAAWDGRAPGMLAYGPTGHAKTWAVWVALGRLYVRENQTFVFFPIARLLDRIKKLEGLEPALFDSRGCRIVFVDDADKFNADFDSERVALFEFYDHMSVTKRPVITTTNQDRKWWEKRMGEAFARRLFEETTVVKF
jgi:DNA replication protein DnaC